MSLILVLVLVLVLLVAIIGIPLWIANHTQRDEEEQEQHRAQRQQQVFSPPPSRTPEPRRPVIWLTLQALLGWWCYLRYQSGVPQDVLDMADMVSRLRQRGEQEEGQEDEEKSGTLTPFASSSSPAAPTVPNWDLMTLSGPDYELALHGLLGRLYEVYSQYEGRTLARDRYTPRYFTSKQWDYLIGPETPGQKQPGLLRQAGIVVVHEEEGQRPLTILQVADPLSAYITIQYWKQRRHQQEPSHDEEERNEEEEEYFLTSQEGQGPPPYPG